MNANANHFGNQLLSFTQRLDQAKIPYSLRRSRDNALMVVAFAPGEYWEIEFLADGDVEVERYRSDGKIHDATVLEELFALWSDNGSARNGGSGSDANAEKITV